MRVFNLNLVDGVQIENTKVSTSPFPVQVNIRFVLIKSKSKTCHSGPYVLFKTHLACQ